MPSSSSTSVLALAAMRSAVITPPKSSYSMTIVPFMPAASWPGTSQIIV